MNGAPAGGAAWLAAYLGRAEARNPNGTLLMDGGDMVGATPLESQYFEDRPTIDVANAIGYDDVTFGNHEFDAGTDRLARQVDWAAFPYWSANVIDRSTHKPFLHPAPYEIFRRNDVNVGVINLTTEATPGIVNPSSIEGLSFASTVKTANMAVAKLEKLGIRTVVLVGHLGTDQCLPEPKPGCDGNTLVTDPDDIARNEAAKLAREVNDEVDLIVAGHTDVDLTRAQAPSAPPGGESNLGDVATDAMNWQADQFEGTVDFAFANSGGIRADIPAGDITRGEVIEAFPFQNVLATTTLTGAQVKEVLEQGASGQYGMVQVSGLRFTYDPSRPVGSRVTSITVLATGQPIDPRANYRVVTNDFMLNGGDNYTTFQQGANPVVYSNELLSDAIVRYLQQSGPINQLIEKRITAP